MHTASDLYLGKTGEERPLELLPPERRDVFQNSLAEMAPSDWQVFLLNGGMTLRGPGISPARLKALLREDLSR